MLFKKNDTLPAILALISTLAVLGLGYGVVNQFKSASTAKNGNNVSINSNGDRNLTAATSAVSFSDPGIVPMGISVKINGAPEMLKMNKLLKRSFQQEFPGTTVVVNSDGNETGMRLLASGQVDIAAIARPLDEEEQAKGLVAVTVTGDYLESLDYSNSDSETFFYAYREPANSKVEAFLGHLFSAQGQEAIVDR